MKRIRFTKSELEVIATMIGIAGAGGGDGDYEPWSETDWKALDTLTNKVSALRMRLESIKQSPKRGREDH